MNAESVRLYGLPHAERMFLDVASLYETEIDGDLDVDSEESAEFTVEEWSVLTPLDQVMPGWSILEHIEEWLCDEHSHDYDACHPAFTTQAVSEAVEDLRRAIAEGIQWQQADKHLADHKLTVLKGEVFLDGQPLYRPALNDGRDDADSA